MPPGCSNESYPTLVSNENYTTSFFKRSNNHTMSSLCRTCTKVSLPIIHLVH